MIRAGASRKLAAFITESAPDVFAVCEIEPGGAFSLATRFALQWAYRGGQALFWNVRFAAGDIQDTYLPVVSPLPIDRRGFLRVDGVLEGDRCSLITTQIDEVRERRILGLRFLRAQLRACESRVLLFAHMQSHTNVRDLGFENFIDEGGLQVSSRGFDPSALRASSATI